MWGQDAGCIFTAREEGNEENKREEGESEKASN